MKTNLKKVIAWVAMLCMVIVLVPSAAFAEEHVEVNDEESSWEEEIFFRMGISSVIGTGSANRYFASGECVPDGTLFWYLNSTPELNAYLDPDTWCYELGYEEYISIADLYFVNHSDMRDYLTRLEYLNPETDEISIFSGGMGDAWDWIVLSTYKIENEYKIQGLFLNQPVYDTTGLVENVDYYDGMYIDEALELTVVDTEYGWKIAGYEVMDYYIIDGSLYHKVTEEGMSYTVKYESVEITYYNYDAEAGSNTIVEDNGVTLWVDKESQYRLEDSFEKFKHNDLYWRDTTSAVTFIPEVQDGYQLMMISYNDEVGQEGGEFPSTSMGVYHYLPAGPLKIGVFTMKEENTDITEIFTDVESGQWYEEAVTTVYEKGLMTGTGTTTFSPHDDMTRAMMVTTIYRLAGKPEVTEYKATQLFGDVQAGEWYEDAINWAYQTGVTTGYPDTMQFGVWDNVTREQLAVFLYRYAKLMNCDVSTYADITGYVGYSSVSEYAKKAMSWAVGAGLISGIESVENGMKIYDLAPAGDATRAQLAMILMRFCNYYEL